MSASAIQTLMEAAATAIASADYSTAKSKALQAQAQLAAMPDSARASAQLTWNREAIENFIMRMDREIGRAHFASNGIQRSKITYAEVSD